MKQEIKDSLCGSCVNLGWLVVFPVKEPGMSLEDECIKGKDIPQQECSLYVKTEKRE